MYTRVFVQDACLVECSGHIVSCVAFSVLRLKTENGMLIYFSLFIKITFGKSPEFIPIYQEKHILENNEN